MLKSLGCTIYKTFEAELYMEEITDIEGRKHSFYQLITEHAQYTLSAYEGLALEKRLRKIDTTFDCEDVDSAILIFSYFCAEEIVH